MRGFRKEWRPEYALWLGVAAFVLSEVVVVFRSHSLYWDEAVFLTMGKYLATGAQQGFWEHIRPPGLPLLIGALYNSGAVVLMVKLLLVGFAALAAVLLYKMLLRHVRVSIAIAAALLLLFSQVWFAYSNLVLTDVFSASIAVVAVWLYTRERMLLAGLAAAAAFLVRFPAGLVLAGLLVTQSLVLQRKRSRDSLKRTGLLLLGFAVPVLIWMSVNAIAWHGSVPVLRAAILPVTDGFTTASADNAGLYTTQPGFYLVYIISKLPLLVLGLLGLYTLRKLPAAMPLALTALFGLAFYEWLPNDQLRFLALMLPGLVLLAAYGAQSLVDRFSLKRTVLVLFALSVAFAIVDDAGLVVQQRRDSVADSAYHDYLLEHPVPGFVLVTDPVTAWHIPNRSVPVYYGLFEYAGDYMPAASAVAIQRDDVVCSRASCSAVSEENWRTLDKYYAVVYTEGNRYVYVRKELLR